MQVSYKILAISQEYFMSTFQKQYKTHSYRTRWRHLLRNYETRRDKPLAKTVSKWLQSAWNCCMAVVDDDSEVFSASPEVVWLLEFPSVFFISTTRRSKEAKSPWSNCDVMLLLQHLLHSPAVLWKFQAQRNNQFNSCQLPVQSNWVGLSIPLCNWLHTDLYVKHKVQNFMIKHIQKYTFWQDSIYFVIISGD